MNSFNLFSKIMFVFTILLIYLNSNNYVISESIPFKSCSPTKQCEILKVDVNPCPEVKENKPCKLRKATDVILKYTFIPHFFTERGEVTHETYRAYWYKIPILVSKSSYINDDSSEYVEFPIQAGLKRTTDYTAHILPTHPSCKITMEWKLWNDKKKQYCCLKFEAQIVK